MIEIGANLFALLFSLVLMWWSGDGCVRYALITSRLYGLSKLFIGFVLLAIATGLPELAIIITGTLGNASGLSAGGIIGSNFSDISLVLGVPALCVGAIMVPPAEKRVLLGMLAITTYLMAVVFILQVLYPWHSILLIPLFFISMWVLWETHHAREVIEDRLEHVSEVHEKEVFLAGKTGTLIKLTGSSAVLLASSHFVVHYGVMLAGQFKLPIETIGTTLVAVGTSLPELTLSIAACRRKEYSLALGNAFGSVLEQGSLLLGLLALISPHPIDLSSFKAIIPFMFGAFFIVGLGVLFRNKVNRLEGAALVALFVAYWVYVLYLHPVWFATV